MPLFQPARMDNLHQKSTTCPDTLTTEFNLLPARISQRLGYLEGQSFRRNCGEWSHKERENIHELNAVCVHGHFYQPPREDPLSGS